MACPTRHTGNEAVPTVTTHRASSCRAGQFLLKVQLGHAHASAKEDVAHQLLSVGVAAGDAVAELR
eukprot:4942100-Prymnesium_polylepis.1